MPKRAAICSGVIGAVAGCGGEVGCCGGAGEVEQGVGAARGGGGAGGGVGFVAAGAGQVFVEDAGELGAEGGGFVMAMQSLDNGRRSVGAAAAGGNSPSRYTTASAGLVATTPLATTR